MYILCVAIHSFIDHRSYSVLKNLPMRITPGIVCFTSPVHSVQSMLAAAKHSLLAMTNAASDSMLCNTQAP